VAKWANSLVATEDRAARRLVKAETTEDTSDSDDENEEEEKAKFPDDSDDDPDDAVNKMGKSQYEKDKEKNIEELKEILSEIKAKYPMPEEFARKNIPKVPAVKRGKEGRTAPESRRVSQRVKDKR
jgi:hypothetical protein